MGYFISDILENDVLMASLASWLAAQVLKILLYAVTAKKWDLERLVGSGGMPSSHSALVVGLCTSIAIYKGLSSVDFALAFVFSAVVMYDAAGVRRAAGQQARILNSILDEIHEGKDVDDKKLKELLGHTPVEVLAGAVLGFVVAYGLYIIK